ncbi:MAG: phosphoglycerate kinase [Polyangiaceae bacterium]
MAYLDGIKSIRDLPIENKRVFLRVDFNVPLKDGVITDDARIKEALPTIKHALERGVRLVIASHLGRPKKGPDADLSLAPCGERLAELLNLEVKMPEDCIGDAAKKVVFDLRGGQICLLENLRFHSAEEKDDEAFARELASYADIYVDDAFGAVHRAHASVHALAKLFDERGCGFLLEKEIAALGKLVTSPEKPYIAVLGGAKVSDKIEVVEALLAKVDALVVGGAMANTFLAAKGNGMGKSKVEGDKLALARTILERARDAKVEVLLPVDVVVAESLDSASGKVVDANAVPDDMMALDIGPKTVEAFSKRFSGAKTVFWNGPMGLFERKSFSSGTFGVARALADCGAYVVVGGGDSAAAVHSAGGDIESKMGHVSTGGGASLELIEGKKLPGIEVLRKIEKS